MEHSRTSAIGTSWERTPWRAVFRQTGQIRPILHSPSVTEFQMVRGLGWDANRRNQRLDVTDARLWHPPRRLNRVLRVPKELFLP